MVDQRPVIELEEFDQAASAPSPWSAATERVVDRRRGFAIAFLLVVALLLVVTAIAVRLRDARDEARARVASLEAERTIERQTLGNAGSLPTVDPTAGGVVLLPSNTSLRNGALAVMMTPNDVDHIWLFATGTGGVPGDRYSISGGNCGADPPTLQEWASGFAGRDGSVRMTASRLSIDRHDPGFWIQVRHGADDLGGVRGPLSEVTSDVQSLIRLAPGATACTGG